MKILIPSYRRSHFINDPRVVYNQLSDLEPIYVIRQDEIGYEKTNHIKLPNTIKHIGDTRQWIIDNYGNELIWMFDDDVSLFTLHFEGEGPVHFNETLAQEMNVSEFLELTEKLKSSRIAGIPLTKLWNAWISREVKLAPYMPFRAIMIDRPLEMNLPDLNDWPLNEDSLLFFGAAKNGYPVNVVMSSQCRYLITDKKTKPLTSEDGGIWTYRTDQLKTENNQKLLKWCKDELDLEFSKFDLNYMWNKISKLNKNRLCDKKKKGV